MINDSNFIETDKIFESSLEILNEYERLTSELFDSYEREAVYFLKFYSSRNDWDTEPVLKGFYEKFNPQKDRSSAVWGLEKKIMDEVLMQINVLKVNQWELDEDGAFLFLTND